MEKFSMKLIVLISYIFIGLLTISGCNSEPTLPKSAIFSDVIKIDILPESGSMDSVDDFYYTLPEEVKYAIVELFDDTAVFTDNPEKEVPVDHLVAGSRTGFEDIGFTRSSVSAAALFAVNSNNTDFDRSNILGSITAIPFYWIVLGYDENMILTHASPAGLITLTLP